MEKTMGPEWLGYEARRLGWVGMILPVMVMLGFCSIAVAMTLTGSGGDLVGLRTTAGLEDFLPLVAGLAAAFVVADEPALELHLTLQTPYQVTVARRLTLAVGWTAMVAVSWAVALRVSGLWAWHGPFLMLQLGWLAPVLWYVSFGILLTLLVRSRWASGAILGGVWLASTSLGGLLTNYDWISLLSLSSTTYGLRWLGMEWWLANRAVLVAISAAMAFFSVRILRDNEALVRGGDR